MEPTDLLVPDLQSSEPEVRIGLSRAGVRGVNKAIRLRRGPREKLVFAEISCSVDLDPAQRGVHMSRFPELFEQAVDELVIGEALLVEELAEHIARAIVERQEALRAEVEVTARYPIQRETPVTRMRTQEMVSLIGIAAASARGARRIVGVEATGINACPCAQGLVRGRASERLLDAGFGEDEVERIFELVPLATHNQRGRGTLYVGTDRPVNAEDLVDIVEHSMSSPIYELLKRPDELFVVEHAHLQPRFVEDSVRVALKAALDAYPELAGDDFLWSRQVNLETIHTHDVLAERYGTVAELRGELDARRPAGAPHRAARVADRMTRTKERIDHGHGHGPRPALARDRPERRPQHLRRCRSLALGRPPRRLVRPRHGVREPNPLQRPGGRLVGPPRGGRALLERAQPAGVDDGPAGLRLARRRRSSNRLSVPAASRRRFALCRSRIAAAGRPGERDHRPRVAEHRGEARQR